MGGNMERKLVMMLLFVTMLCSVAGCGKTGTDEGEEKLSTHTTNRTETIGTKPEEPGKQEGVVKENCSEQFLLGATDFSIKLLQENLKKENRNVMVSPLSVLTALSMTANGAEGQTREQMLSVLAPGQDMDSLNADLQAYTNSLSDSDEAVLKAANSIWFKDNDNQIRVEESFLETNASLYQADIYKAPFDESTLKDINTWVSDRTEERVQNILAEIPEDAVMYLINALAFDAEWQIIYNDFQIRDGDFHISKDEVESIPFMYGEEEWYLQDEKACGFVKPYKGGYSFVALLPDEGISVQEYVDSLDGEKFRTLLSEKKEAVVMTSLPKFKAEYEVELGDMLKALGMPDAFDKGKADFSSLGTSEDGNIYITRVLHKTYIAVDEKGTEAGAATVVEMITESAAMEPEEVYRVYLDRPFVYAIVDEEYNLPVFIGTMDGGLDK